MASTADALALAERGLRVHPLRPGTKVAVVKDWPALATGDRATIEAWWRSYPDANIGVATGGGLVVLDIDGPTGETSLNLKQAASADTRPTFTVKTPHGHHLYYLTAIPVRNSAGRHGPGLDVRGEHGYVVGPGSSVDGTVYTIVSHLSMAPAPKWVTEPPPAATTQPVAPGEPIPVGQQDETLYKIACRLRGKGWNYDGILAELQTIPLDHADGRRPYELADYQRLARSACQHPKGEPPVDFTHNPASRPLGSAPEPQPLIPFRVRTVVQILTDPLPAPLVGRLIAEGSFAAMFGPEWSGKSLVALDIQLSMAAGIPCCLGIPLNQAPVLYVLAEGTLRSRIQAWQYAHPGANLDAFRSHEEGFNFADKRHVEALFGYVLQEQPVLVTFDTLAATIGGDENSNVDMGKVIATCQEIQRITNRKTATLLLAHPGKDAAKGIRGHSSLPAALETSIQVIGVESPKYADEVEVGEPTGGSVTLRPRKNRDGAKGKDITAAILSAGESVYLAHDSRQRALSAGGLEMLRQLAENGVMSFTHWGTGTTVGARQQQRLRGELIDQGYAQHFSLNATVGLTSAGEGVI